MLYSWKIQGYIIYYTVDKTNALPVAGDVCVTSLIGSFIWFYDLINSSNIRWVTVKTPQAIPIHYYIRRVALEVVH